MPNIAEAGRPGLFSRTTEVAANVATLVVATLLSVVLVKSYFFPTLLPQRTTPARTADVAAIGTNLTKRVPGVNWNKNGQTLILVLSTHCHFCTESAPFFRQIKEKAGKNVKVVGLLPQPVAESEVYLDHEGLRLDEVHQMSLEKVGVSGTPTMLLVNKDGAVTQTWIGKLEPDKQEQVLKAIAMDSGKTSSGAL